MTFQPQIPILIEALRSFIYMTLDNHFINISFSPLLAALTLSCGMLIVW